MVYVHLKGNCSGHQKFQVSRKVFGKKNLFKSLLHIVKSVQFVLVLIKENIKSLKFYSQTSSHATPRPQIYQESFAYQISLPHNQQPEEKHVEPNHSTDKLISQKLSTSAHETIP